MSFGSGFTQESFAQSINIDEAVTQGLELASRWQFAPRWSLSGNYTYSDSEQKSGINKGAPLTNTPEHMLNASLNWNASERLTLWIKGEYRGERARFTDKYENLTAANQALQDEVGDLKAYEVFHLGGSYKASENVTFNASIYNLFDKDFLDGETYTTDTGAVGWASTTPSQLLPPPVRWRKVGASGSPPRSTSKSAPKGPPFQGRAFLRMYVIGKSLTSTARSALESRPIPTGLVPQPITGTSLPCVSGSAPSANGTGSARRSAWPACCCSPSLASP